MFDTFDTAYLEQARKALIHPIPGDPTFLATVGTLLRAAVSEALADPARIERDKAAVEKAAADAKAAEEKAAAEAEAAQKPVDKSIGAAGNAQTKAA